MFDYKELENKEPRKCTHRIIIELDMDEYENKLALNRYVKSLDMALCLSDLVDQARGKLKNSTTPKQYKVNEKMLDDVIGTLDKYGIILDDLFN